MEKAAHETRVPFLSCHRVNSLQLAAMALIIAAFVISMMSDKRKGCTAVVLRFRGESDSVLLLQEDADADSSCSSACRKHHAATPYGLEQISVLNIAVVCSFLSAIMRKNTHFSI